VEIRETGPGGPTVHLADLRHGHKTGLYLDQRRNRLELAELVAAGALPEGAEALNCFAYTGAFGHALLTAGSRVARVTHVESSEPALELLRRTAGANGFDPGTIETAAGNAFSVLRGFRAEERRFDLVILDPPRFVESRRQLDKAARGYKDVNLLACQLLNPGGLLATFSCSGLLAPDLFRKIVADAALDAGRDARILRHLSQADDHPTALSFPEGRYLKGVVCRIW
jgi:23S rRNA (cytosine1962-C5)-methyltransferase